MPPVRNYGGQPCVADSGTKLPDPLLPHPRHARDWFDNKTSPIIADPRDRHGDDLDVDALLRLSNQRRTHRAAGSGNLQLRGTVDGAGQTRQTNSQPIGQCQPGQTIFFVASDAVRTDATVASKL